MSFSISGLGASFTSIFGFGVAFAFGFACGFTGLGSAEHIFSCLYL